MLLGQGTGGAALALLPADRILAAEHAWLAPLAPEGASAIVYRDTSHAPDLAARQGIRATDLAADGIIDRVIPEPPADPAGSAATSGTRCTGRSRTWQTRTTTHAWPGACAATAASGCHPIGGRYPRRHNLAAGHAAAARTAEPAAARATSGNPAHGALARYAMSRFIATGALHLNRETLPAE